MNDKENSVQKGDLYTNKHILYSIVSLATKEICGVAGLSAKSGCAVPKLFQNNDFDGVRIKVNNMGAVEVDVFIDVYSNTKVPELCYRVQENIKNSVLTMADVKTAKVNVHIVNVIVKRDEDDESTI